ncbi:MAG: hypothetical protein QOI95_3174 [Acidimicrobiaceae bacterium]|jgi:hypothetical protein
MILFGALGITVVLVVAAVGAAVARHKSGASPPSPVTLELRQAASRSLAATSFREKISGSAAAPSIVGTVDFESPDRARFVPATSDGIESIVIGRKIFIRERAPERFIVYDQGNPRYFDSLRDALSVLTTANNVTRTDNGYRFIYDFNGDHIAVDVTVTSGVVTDVSYESVKGVVRYEFEAYGATTVAEPDPAKVDQPQPNKPCLPPGQQDPKVVCRAGN